MATSEPVPTPICLCSKAELLRDIPGSKVSDACPLCESAGRTILIGFHPVGEQVASPSAASAPLQPASAEMVIAQPLELSALELALLPDVSTTRLEEHHSPQPLPEAPPAYQPDPSSLKKVRSFIAPSGASYTGETKNNDIAHGYGVLIAPSGTKYEGFWDLNRRHGLGKEWNAVDHTIYDGEWKHNKHHGQGRLYDQEGRMIQSGIWKKGNLVQSDSSVPIGFHPSRHQAASPTQQPLSPSSVQMRVVAPYEQAQYMSPQQHA